MNPNIQAPEKTESASPNKPIQSAHIPVDVILPPALRTMAVLAFGGLLYLAAATAPPPPPLPVPEPEPVSEIPEEEPPVEEIPEDSDVISYIAVGSSLVQLPDQHQILLEIPYLKLFGKSQLDYLSLSTTLSAANGYHSQKLLNQANLLQKQLSAQESSEALQDTLYLEQETVSLRRADSRYISLLFSGNTYASPDRLHYSYSADNYDASTGRSLTLSDVVLDVPALYGLVQAQLENYWPYISCEISAVDYLTQTPPDQQVWTLDYNGITFYFEEGTLSSTDGEQFVTVPFDMAPAIFAETCLQVPDTYAVSLTEEQPFYYDVDGDGGLEEIVLSYLHNYYGECEAFRLMINGDSSGTDLLLEGIHPESCSSYIRHTDNAAELVIETHMPRTESGTNANDRLLTFTIEKDTDGNYILIFETSDPSPLITMEATDPDGSIISCRQILTQ